MNIFEIAMQMEKEGEAHYRKLASQADDEGLKNIFNLLADDEVKHFRVFEKMAGKTEIEMSDTPILDDVRKIFREMQEEAKSYTGAASQEQVYRRALEGEEENIAAYEEFLEQAVDDNEKAVIRKIIEEEKKHAFLLSGLIEFVRQPDAWLENAEFNQWESY
jgi:rubrerythrin